MGGEGLKKIKNKKKTPQSLPLSNDRPYRGLCC